MILNNLLLNKFIMENNSVKDLLKSITLDDRDQVEILVSDIIRQKVSDKFTNAIQNVQSNEG